MVGENNGNLDPEVDVYTETSYAKSKKEGVDFVNIPPTRPGVFSSKATLIGDLVEAEKCIPLAVQQLAEMHRQNVNNLEIYDRMVDLGNSNSIYCQRNFTADNVTIRFPGGSTVSEWDGVGPDPDTREVYIRLSWDTYADLDLWVTDPCGTKIYYGNKESTCQGCLGFLDVDANVGSYTLSPVEIVSWVNAPKGTYKVQINYFADHQGSPGIATYVVFIKGLETYYGNIINTESTRTVDIATFTVS